MDSEGNERDLGVSDVENTATPDENLAGSDNTIPNGNIEKAEGGAEVSTSDENAPSEEAVNSEENTSSDEVANTEESVGNEEAAGVAESEAAAPAEAISDSAEAVADTEIKNKTSALSEAENQKKSKAPVILGGILVVLLFVAIACGALLFNNSKPSNNSANNQSEQVTDNTIEPSELKMNGNELSDFDLYFSKNNSENKNIIYSPLSIKYALSMLADGANGESKEQIKNIIGDYKAKRYLNSLNRSLANALFVRNDFKENVLDSYISGLQNNYGADVIFDDFNDASGINNWVSNQTLGIIDGLIDDDTASELNFALINALAIDMNWNYALQCVEGSGAESLWYDISFKFEKYRDSVECGFTLDDFNKDTFNGQDGVLNATIGATINNYDIVKELGEDKIREIVKPKYEEWLKSKEADWARKSEDNSVEEDADAFLDTYIKTLDKNYHKSSYSTDFYLNVTDSEKVFAKDLKEYDGATLQYVAIMPTADTLESYMNSIDAETISVLIDDLKPIEPSSFDEGSIIKISGHIPFFKYGYAISDLSEPLKKLGITDIFDKSADLSNMFSVEDQHIDAAIHKANIDFSNDGIKAAAATMIGGRGDVGGIDFNYEFDVPVTEIDITFDQPFFYIIRDKATGEVWFAGETYEIEAQQ